jgi:DNA-binding CsgD family transcriptional regulator
MPADDWSRLFASAFQGSRNGMVLTDAGRVVLDANAAFVSLVGRPHDALVGRPIWELVVGGPLATEQEWQSALDAGHFDGEVHLDATAGAVRVQWAATAETVTGGRRVLFVMLSAARPGGRSRPHEPGERPARGLTAREREIVHLVALGAAGPEIADELHISHETVRTHVRNAMEKLGARSRAHLVAKSLAEGHAFL